MMPCPSSIGPDQYLMPYEEPLNETWSAWNKPASLRKSDIVTGQHRSFPYLRGMEALGCVETTKSQ